MSLKENTKRSYKKLKNNRAESLAKFCTCGRRTPKSCRMTHKCKGCQLSICMYPECDFIMGHQSQVISHYREKHFEMDFENIASGQMYFSMKVKTRCSCGSLLPIRNQKVLRCSQCRIYKCMYNCCNFCSKCRGTVATHQSNKHQYQLFSQRDNYNYCICNYAKCRESDMPHIKCPNKDCDYIRCLVEKCEQNFLSIDRWKWHCRGEHNTHRLRKFKICDNCGNSSKTRETKRTRGTCPTCGWLWCLIGNCICEFETVRGLRRHQGQRHNNVLIKEND